VQERKSKAKVESPAGAPIVITGGPGPMETGGILTIDLAAIEANWRALAYRVSPAECAAVVKADAYGCGIEPVAALLATAGCKTFFVAHLAEARQVRAVAPEAVVYVLNGIPPGTAAAFAHLGARPVIGSMQELAEWDAYCKVHDWRGGAALHFDTGMNRLGLTAEEAASLAMRTRNPDHGIALVMSHLACADAPDHALNNQQVQLFRELRMMFRGIDASLANSSGIFLGPSTHCDLVRPGAALFGVNPTPSAANPMQAVVRLEGRIVQLRQVPRGASVGYAAAWTAPTATRIAVVSVGYGDGYLRAGAALGSEAPQVIVAGRRCPVVGRISMDLLTIDVSALAEHAVRRGDLVTLVGGDIAIADLARWGGTIGYEVLTSLGRRYHRVWKD
jgi:alanine racemase